MKTYIEDNILSTTDLGQLHLGTLMRLKKESRSHGQGLDDPEDSRTVFQSRVSGRLCYVDLDLLNQELGKRPHFPNVPERTKNRLARLHRARNR
jgi:hypothetical protein